MDQLEREWGDEVKVLLLNIHSQDMLRQAEWYDFQFTPTFILYDVQRNEVWRQIGALDAAEVRTVVDQLRTP